MAIQQTFYGMNVQSRSLIDNNYFNKKAVLSG